MDQMREKWNDFLVQMDEAKKERWEKQQEVGRIQQFNGMKL